MSYLQQLLITCPLIFLSGFIDSIAGGGGLIGLPAYMAVGLPPHLAMGTGKLSSSFGCTTSAIRFYKNKSYNKKALIPSIVFAFIGSAIGARLAIYLSAEILNYILIITIPVIAVFILTKKDFRDTTLENQSDKRTFIASALIGLFIGWYDGFLGSGSGTFFILMYIYFAGFGLLESMGTSKVVNLATNVSAIAIFMYYGQIDYGLAIPTGICAILGNYLGSGLAIKNGKKIVRPMLVIVLVMLLGKLLYDTFLSV